jgi:FxLD family lantipeptide
MAPTNGTTVRPLSGGLDMAEFSLDVRVLEASAPVAELMRSTSDNCGSSCSGTACTSFTDDPA